MKLKKARTQNNQLTFDGEYRYTYDDEGNRIAKGKTRYYWDHRNRLVKVVTPKQTVEYQYDYRNRLTRRNDEFFVHDNWQIVCSFKNGKIADRYLWGARQDELLSENDDFVLSDHLGTIRKIADKNGETVSDLKYNAFGKLVSCKGTLPRFRYTAKLFDDATELQWNINRWYDANVGRWCSEDPIGFASKEKNLHRYSANSQISRLDSSGLETREGYVDSGAKHCKVYHVDGLFSWFSSHVFLAVNGQSFGFYQKNDGPIGSGQIIENEFSSAPENSPEDGGEFYSICKRIWIDGRCYDPDYFQSRMILKKNQDAADPPFYIIGIFDCTAWAANTIGYSLRYSFRLQFENKEQRCLCEGLARDGHGWNYYLEP